MNPPLWRVFFAELRARTIGPVCRSRRAPLSWRSDRRRTTLRRHPLRRTRHPEAVAPSSRQSSRACLRPAAAATARAAYGG